MFKRYNMKWNDGVDDVQVVFYVHSRRTRSGFQHRACVIGRLPRLDENADYRKYTRNSDKLTKGRIQKIGYVNRTWEYWPGQTCLVRLWEKLCNLSFVDMGRVSLENPFLASDEPPCEHLDTPEDIFR